MPREHADRRVERRLGIVQKHGVAVHAADPTAALVDENAGLMAEELRQQRLIDVDRRAQVRHPDGEGSTVVYESRRLEQLDEVAWLPSRRTSAAR